MSEPIISPWIFYVADVVGSINLVINVLMWILCIATAIALLNIMIPARDTFYKMTVTNYITPANIDKASDIVDKITDKIIERINKRDK